jgi:hypothetical protein
MTDLAARLQAMHVRAEVPGGLLSGELRDRSEVVVTFGGSGYYRTTEAELERQIVSLCRLLVVSWSRGYWDVISEIAGRRISGEGPPMSEASVEYRKARDSMVVSGQSADGRITITYNGAHNGWSAKIQPGTLTALSEEDFIRAGREASRALYAAHQEMIIRLKAQIFGRAAEKARSA